MRRTWRRCARITLGLVPLVVMGSAGCAAVDALGLSKPSAKVVGVSLKDVGLQAATLVFDVAVDNPYGVPLPLVNVDYDLASQGKAFLSGKAAVQGAVPARGTKTISVPAKVTFQELLSVLKGVRPGAVVPYQAELGLSVDPPLTGPIRLPIKKEGQLPVPTVPEVSVQEVKWDKLSLNEAGGRFRLNMVNRNQFPVELSQFKYALSLGETEVARSSLMKSVAFGASGGAGTLDIPVSFSPKDMGLGLFRMLLGKTGGYGLKGMLDLKTPFGPMSLPIDKVGSTVFRK